MDVSIEIKTSNSKKDGPIKHIMPHRNLAFLHHQALEFAKKCGIKNAALERVGYKEQNDLVEVYDTLDMRLAMNKAGRFRDEKKIHFVIKVNSTSAQTDQVLLGCFSYFAIVKITLLFTVLELLVTVPIGITVMSLDRMFALPLISMISMMAILFKALINVGLYSSADEDGSIEHSSFDNTWQPLTVILVVQLFPILIVSAVSGDSQGELFLPFFGYLAFKFALDVSRILIFRHISKQLGNNVPKVDPLPTTGDEYEQMLMATNEAIAISQQEGTIAPPQGTPLVI